MQRASLSVRRCVTAAGPGHVARPIGQHLFRLRPHQARALRHRVARSSASPNGADSAAELRHAVAAALSQALASSSVQLEQHEVQRVASLVPGLAPADGGGEVQDPLVLAQLPDNVACLRRFLSPTEVCTVLRVAPAVLGADLNAWFDFLQQYGFTNEQISYLLCQAPQALATANLVSAGDALTTMRQAGLDEGSARALIVAYPQLLHSTRQELAAMLRTLSRFRTGVLDVSC